MPSENIHHVTRISFARFDTNGLAHLVGIVLKLLQGFDCKVDSFNGGTNYTQVKLTLAKDEAGRYKL